MIVIYQNSNLKDIIQFKTQKNLKLEFRLLRNK